MVNRAAGRPRVGFVADALLRDDGSMFEGGAERHLYYLARVAMDLGAEVVVYQKGAHSSTREFQGMKVVSEPVTYRSLGLELSRRAEEEGCTHLHFSYVERVPRGRDPERTTGTCHAMYWDIPYEDRYRDWYPGGRLARVGLPAWRRLHHHRMISGLSRVNAAIATDTTVLRVVHSDRPELRSKLEVIINFSDLAGASAAEGLERSGEPPLGGQLRALEEMGRARREGRTVVLVPRNLSFVRGGAWIADILRSTVEDNGVDAEFFFTAMPVDLYRSGERYMRLLRSSLDRLEASTRCRLHLTGGLPHNAMADAYSLADIVLVPTYAHEGSPLAAIEALSMGVPVVCTNIGGLNDVVRDNWTGLIANASPVSIAEALARLSGDPDLRRRLGEEGRREASVRFTLPAWQEKVVQFGRRAGWANQ